MNRWALLLAVLAAAVAVVVLVTSDKRGDDARPTDRRPATARTQPQIAQPAQRILCPSSYGRPPRPGSFDARQLLGMTVRDAERRARRGGCSMRVVTRNGEFLSRTDDSLSDRINVEVEGGLVVRIEGVS